MRRFTALLLAAGSALSGSLHAAPCAGFTDVDSADQFCPNIEWIKNRGITLGCGTGLYCPAQPVLRDQVAAFLNRLGNALEPTFTYAEQFGIGPWIDSSTVVCVTPPVVIAGYPRIASPIGSLVYVKALAPNPALYTARLVYSTNGGTVWNDWSSVHAGFGAQSVAYGTISPTANPMVLNVGQSLQFAIQPNKLLGAADDAGCQLAVRMDSHTGATPPY